MSPKPSAPLPGAARHPLVSLARRAARPIELFFQIEASSGIVLVLAAALALVLANSSWAEGYLHFWHAPRAVHVGTHRYERSLEWVVNDGLMVVFFFVVGLEIRRELHEGVLSEWKRAVLPAAAALGGMLAPAAIYLVFAGAPRTHSGWGVPMATDIAFALGVLALLGRRVPSGLRVLLLALAVIDDLGAILVIAAFYSSGVAPAGLVVAALAFGGVLVLRRLGVRSKLVYVLPGVIAWAGVYASGIHPTIAGVVLGLLTPVQAHGAEEASPAESLIHRLHPWVAYAIMPIFALANAGVVVSTSALDGASTSVLLGVSAGLVLGKPIGVFLACQLALKTGMGVLPPGLGARHLLVLGTIAGIGFTMALFVAGLAFTDEALLAASKFGILVASAVAAVVGLGAGALLLPRTADREGAEHG